MRFSVVVILAILASCEPAENGQELRQQIMEADRSFNQMAQEKGIAAAFIYYADEKVIKPSEGKQPVVGKLALMESFKENPPPEGVTLTWDPIKAEASGSLGYTFGGYELRMKVNGTDRDTVMYGNYVSIWKKKKDGSWRYVLDTGNSTPGPIELK